MPQTRASINKPSPGGPALAFRNFPRGGLIRHASLGINIPRSAGNARLLCGESGDSECAAAFRVGEAADAARGGGSRRPCRCGLRRATSPPPICRRQRQPGRVLVHHAAPPTLWGGRRLWWPCARFYGPSAASWPGVCSVSRGSEMGRSAPSHTVAGGLPQAARWGHRPAPTTVWFLVFPTAVGRRGGRVLLGRGEKASDPLMGREHFHFLFK